MSFHAQNQRCPLCRVIDTDEFYQDTIRRYLRCRRCHLVFVGPAFFLSEREEKERYDLHKNSPDDQEYRRFLSRLFLPMRGLLVPGSRGLDFGSGPGPTLSVMFGEAGYPMVVYDPFYAMDLSVLEDQYDFITATEVVEHLHEPGKELNRLWTRLKPGGWLGIMTKLALDKEAFSRWHYKNDPTHVCFFSRPTFEWLAAKWKAELTFSGKDAVLFCKKN